MSDLDGTFRKCLLDIPFGIAIAIQNIIHVIHYTIKYFIEKFEKLYQNSQLRVTD